MAAGSGTSVYPSGGDTDVFDGIAGGLTSIAVGLFVGSDIKQLDKAVSKLYTEANYLAIRFVEFVIAELWWAAHLGTATSELAGYLDEAQQSLNKAQSDQYAAWKEFLEVKYPADLRDLYNLLHVKVKKQPKVDLQPLWTAIKKLQADDSKEKKWQANVATPKLNQWTKFYGTWRRTYLPPVKVLIDWLAHPAHLGSFVLPSVIAGMPSQLRKRQSHASAASIETALLSTWPTQSNAVFGYFLAWLVSDT